MQLFSIARFLDVSLRDLPRPKAKGQVLTPNLSLPIVDFDAIHKCMDLGSYRCVSIAFFWYGIRGVDFGT